MATRIYQGRIVEARFEDENMPQDTESALAALETTNRLFQDAVNYHLVALAAMAEDDKNTLGSRFKKQIRCIWEELPRGKAGACTLQKSIARILNLPSNVSIDDAVADIYDGCERKDVLPYVQHYIIEQTQKGEGAIQQQGREILPKICDPSFKGNFPYSIKEKKAVEGKKRLQHELNRVDISHEELVALAQEMDLSWAGIKTQPNDAQDGALEYDETEVHQQVAETILAMCEVVRSKSDAAWNKYAENAGVQNLHEMVKKELDNTPLRRSLQKNNKTAAELKQAAIFFMFYPCHLSAGMLAAKLGKEKKEESTGDYDFSVLDNDPLILTRGTRGYVYRGYTALPNWETQGEQMYSKEFDILAFKEALKTLHGFELKTKEREIERAKYEAQIKYIEEGVKVKGVEEDNSDEEISTAVLGGDTRFELLKSLVKELSPDAETEYHISTRTLNDYEAVREQWQKRETESECDSQELVKIVREYQAKSRRFGSQVLFEALCQDKYRPIWHDCEPAQKGKFPRSSNMLRDFSNWQYLNEQREKYTRPVHVTAADAVVSPRQMLYSDIMSLGNGKGSELISGCRGGLRLQVLVRNEKGRWESAPIKVRFSAPRFIRDELGIDAGNWMVPKKGENTTLPWLQPMMKALGQDVAPVRLGHDPAVGLQIKGQGNEARFYLNFPVTLDMESLHQSIGKASIWQRQFLGGNDEKLHLHWPATYKGNKSAWWLNKDVLEHGVTVLGIDLGLRCSFAWSLVGLNNQPTVKSARGEEVSGCIIGDSGNAKWYGYVLKQGLSRIPGEGVRDVSGKKVGAASLPSEQDKKLARRIFDAVGGAVPIDDDCDVLQLGNRTLKAFKRLMSRLKTYLSFLAGLNDTERKEDVRKRIHDYFSYAETIPGILDSLKEVDTTRAYDLVYTEVEKIKSEMPSLAESLTSLILPRKHGHWEWVPERRDGWQGSGKMCLLEGKDETRRPVYHRGGLSVARLTQLETLRQLLQSMSKVLYFVPGELVTFGRDLKNQNIIDPCPEILEKIENMREQRVNLIAHNIVAQTLGVRLLPSRDGKNADGLDVIHGEYELIPGRRPVDFVVLENLSRYMTSLDRTPDENSSLMRWAHRQIVAKVKQLLEEVFGIPVIFTHAQYTSRFDSLTSEPGFRPSPLNIEHLEWIQKQETKGGHEKKSAGVYLAVWEQVVKAGKQAKVTLLQPHHANGGEYFLSQQRGKLTLRNADMNAATNIVWRGVAAPESLHLLHRVRMDVKKSGVVPTYGNEREKGVKKVWKLNPLGSVQTEGSKISAFAVSPDWDKKVFATYGDSETQYHLCHGKVLWGIMKKMHWSMCHKYNILQLKKAGIETRLIEQLLIEEETDSLDDIPM
ncbi:MAG: type V CRISPR-associated protein Cas12b [Akkermansia sp.]|nr:type V CRISPR-associated protein Cas12b [Akkermansia sp.]